MGQQREAGETRRGSQEGEIGEEEEKEEGWETTRVKRKEITGEKVKKKNVRGVEREEQVRKGNVLRHL